MPVTIIVPTYNRAGLLRQTIPTYLQEDVSRLILVDDCSSDNTPEVAASLAAEYPGVIEYVRNDANRKQTFSKNRGKALADTEFVYFGDDDSILIPGSIAALLATRREYGADVVGSVALYCANGERPEDAYRRYLQGEMIDRPDDYVDMRRLRFRFTQRPSSPLRVPTAQACVLVSREWYRRIDFDLRYKGNCYREETDFLLQMTRSGARILVDGRAAQINLAPQIARGGARSCGRLAYEWQSLVNTWKFLSKHREYFRHEIGVGRVTPLLWFIQGRVTAMFRKVAG
jgi:glycosyltransferase involved in cell wall biosynthesis